MSDRVDELRSQLEQVAEQLADLSMEVLREAIEEGAEKRPVADKTLSQARRAVEKAVHLLARLEVEE